jgi:hypothetical protein
MPATTDRDRFVSRAKNLGATYLLAPETASDELENLGSDEGLAAAVLEDGAVLEAGGLIDGAAKVDLNGGRVRGTYVERYERKVTIKGEHIAADLTDARVPIEIPAGVAARADLQDIRFSTLAGVRIPHQMMDPDPGYLDGSLLWNRNPDPRQVEIDVGEKRILISAGCSGNNSYVTQVDAATGLNGKRVVLFEAGNKDDHRTPCIVPLSDGNAVFILTGHGGTVLRYWKTVTPGDISSVGAEQQYTHPKGWHFSHPSAFRLEDEEDRIVVIYRANDITPEETPEAWSFMYSDDLATIEAGKAATFSTPTVLFNLPDNSYIKPASDNKSIIDFLITDGTPGNSANKEVSLYHLYMEGEELKKSTGTKAKAWSELGESLAAAIAPGEMTKVIDWAVYGSLWNWSIRRRDNGRVLIATTAHTSTLLDVDDLTEIAYVVAETDGSGAWSHEKLVDAGEPVSLEGQPAGAGGIYIAYDAEAIFLSREVDGNHEVEKWTGGLGEWSSHSLSEHNTQIQFRPCCPMGREEAPEVTWAAGLFTTGDEFETRKRSWPAFPSPYTRTTAWIKVPTLKKETDCVILVHSGCIDECPLEPEGFDVWDANDLVVYDMARLGPSGLLHRDSLGTRNPLTPNASIAEQAGLLGRSQYWGTEATGGMATQRVDLDGDEEGEVIASLKTDRDNGAPRTIASNFATTEPGIQARTKNATNQLEFRIVREANSIIGGPFPDSVLTKNANAHVVLRFKSGDALRAHLNNVESATTFAMSDTLDKTPPINRAFGVGKAPANNTEMWAGQIHHLRYRNKQRPAAERTLEYKAWTDQAGLISFGSPLSDKRTYFAIVGRANKADGGKCIASADGGLYVEVVAESTNVKATFDGGTNTVTWEGAAPESGTMLIALTRDGTSATLYVNGESKGVKTVVRTSPSGSLVFGSP